MNQLNTIEHGTITTPEGFLAGATYIGLKTVTQDALDLGILYSEKPCTTAGVFTTNRIKAAPVVVSQERITTGKGQAVVVNSGCANACTGEQGLKDAREMATLTAKKLGLSAGDVLVASTGIIGKTLPMDKISSGIRKIALSRDNGHVLARAIITTDPFPKETAVKVKLGKREAIIGGIAKGSGMIHPNMATLLCFLATDAAVAPGFLNKALKEAVDVSFNMITVDGDTSTNDSAIILANGMAGNPMIKEGTAAARAFQAGLDQVCIFLAKEIARGGEGATRLIEVTVDGALSVADARSAARTIAGSNLVKSAVHGSDPNWGRIVAALGRSGAEVVGSKVDVHIGNICLMKAGQPLPFDEQAASALLDKPEVFIKVGLNLGTGAGTAWGCDLSQEYVTINSAYRT